MCPRTSATFAFTIFENRYASRHLTGFRGRTKSPPHNNYTHRMCKPLTYLFPKYHEKVGLSAADEKALARMIIWAVHVFRPAAVQGPTLDLRLEIMVDRLRKNRARKRRVRRGVDQKTEVSLMHLFFTREQSLPLLIIASPIPRHDPVLGKPNEECAQKRE